MTHKRHRSPRLVHYIVSARYYLRQHLDAEPFGCIAIYDQFERVHWCTAKSAGFSPLNMRVI